MWRVGPAGKLDEVSPGRLDLEARLEDWITADINLVDPELLVIGRQIGTDHGGYIDLLAVDRSGDLVLLELKRGRTPREVVAQALDYASWVADLSHERVTEIADEHLGGAGSFETAFRGKFGADLPETVNASHRIVVVTPQVDSSSERIIQYLSRTYGVSINAVTFQYFRASHAEEFVTRVFLLEPAEVEHQARIKGASRRKPNLTSEELQQLAADQGVGQLYSESVAALGGLFDGSRTTRSSLGFVGDFNGIRSVMLNLIPGESSRERGLAFQAYSLRFAQRFSVSEEQIVAGLPSDVQPWKYYPAAPEEYRGFQGFFADTAQVNRLAAALARRSA